MKHIEFENVRKAYGKNVIIKNLTMEIKEGERLILLGPSGCGKSTILRMIAGLEEPTEGTIYMGGQAVNDLPCGDRGVSMVFQNYALFPHMTVRKNITYGLEAHKIDPIEIEQRLKDVLTMLELKGLEDRKPKDLSGGQRQRVALARAVVKQADYFLLDEPLSNLDAQLRLHARQELVKIHDLYQPTMVYVTHDQVEAMTVGQRIALVHEGEIDMLDTPSNVYHRPSSVFCGQFIGSPAMNIIGVEYDKGKVRVGKQGLSLWKPWRDLAEKNPAASYFLGIRPEHIVLHRERKGPGLFGVVKYLEDYGNRQGVYIDMEGLDKEIIAICDHTAPRPGQEVFVEIPPEKMHLFDAETEKSLGYPRELQEHENLLPISFGARKGKKLEVENDDISQYQYV